jgi:hypothetical protein
VETGWLKKALEIEAFDQPPIFATKTLSFIIALDLVIPISPML